MLPVLEGPLFRGLREPCNSLDCIVVSVYRVHSLRTICEINRG